MGGDAQIKAMKKVASKVKLELAQYRELASFSQFGSDVDADTKARLDHGARLMEIIKQGQYKPLSVDHQVMIIYAAVNGYLKDVPVESIQAFEEALYEHMDTHHPQIGKELVEKGELSKENESALISALEEFKKITGFSVRPEKPVIEKEISDESGEHGIFEPKADEKTHKKAMKRVAKAEKKAAKEAKKADKKEE